MWLNNKCFYSRNLLLNGHFDCIDELRENDILLNQLIYFELISFYDIFTMPSICKLISLSPLKLHCLGELNIVDILYKAFHFSKSPLRSLIRLTASGPFKFDIVVDNNGGTAEHQLKINQRIAPNLEVLDLSGGQSDLRMRNNVGVLFPSLISVDLSNLVRYVVTDAYLIELVQLVPTLQQISDCMEFVTFQK
jgi:hypothetical protein